MRRPNRGKRPGLPALTVFGLSKDLRSRAGPRVAAAFTQLETSFRTEKTLPLPLWAWAARRTKVGGRGYSARTLPKPPPPNPLPQGEGEDFLHRCDVGTPRPVW